MPKNVGDLLVHLEKKLILLGDEVALAGEKLGMARSGEMKMVKEIMGKR